MHYLHRFNLLPYNCARFSALNFPLPHRVATFLGEKAAKNLLEEDESGIFYLEKTDNCEKLRALVKAHREARIAILQEMFSNRIMRDECTSKLHKKYRVWLVVVGGHQLLSL